MMIQLKLENQRFKMEELIQKIKEYVITKSNQYRETSQDHYDFWNEHIKYVYFEAVELAKIYNANIEIVSLGALLHDIALIEQVGDRKDHHINGKILSDKILGDFGCPLEIKEHVLGCVYNHRSSKNATNIEELCVCDADILAHFDNIPMLFNSAFNRNNISLNEVRNWLMSVFEKDYDDLSEKTKKIFKDRYDLIKDIVINKNI